MSTHFNSTHYASTHYESTHYGRAGVAIVIPINRGGDSSKGARVEAIHRYETPAMIRQRILREDEEIVAIIIAAFEEIIDD